jgi:hypothetical protein
MMLLQSQVTPPLQKLINISFEKSQEYISSLKDYEAFLDKVGKTEVENLEKDVE